MLDGSVAMYDVRTRSSRAALESAQPSERHNDAVMQVKHTQSKAVEGGGIRGGGDGGSSFAGSSALQLGSGGDQGEVLTTISLDGRVVQWNSSKGLDHTEVLKLRRMNPKTKQAYSDTLISRTAQGTCIDFSPSDPLFYIVGTRDGIIHKCSRSYSDYVESYYGHMGSIVKVCFNPYDSDYFLSAGTDSTVRLWHQEHSNAPVLLLSSLHDQPNDICWSPVDSTVFAIGMNDGSVCIWDISISVVDPIISTPPDPDRPITALAFHSGGQLLWAGDSAGSVALFRLVNIGQKHMRSSEKGVFLRNAIKKETGELYDSTPLSDTPLVSLLSVAEKEEVMMAGTDMGELESDEESEEEEGKEGAGGAAAGAGQGEQGQQQGQNGGNGGDEQGQQKEGEGNAGTTTTSSSSSGTGTGDNKDGNAAEKN